MKSIIILIASLLYLSCFSQSTYAAAASITIHSPKDGATLDVMDLHRILYEFDPGPRGEHAHFAIDGENVVMLRRRKGSCLMGALVPGQHKLCLKIINRNHDTIGVQECIVVSVKSDG